MDAVSPPSPFYRVALKALIFDDQGRLLLTQKRTGGWEVPGGGWEHGEDLEMCLRREIQEEIGVTLSSLGPIEWTYRGRNRKGYMALRLVVRAELSSHEFVPGDDMAAAQFFTRDELTQLDMPPDEAVIKEHLDKVWPTVA